MADPGSKLWFKCQNGYRTSGMTDSTSKQGWESTNQYKVQNAYGKAYRGLNGLKKCRLGPKMVFLIEKQQTQFRKRQFCRFERSKFMFGSGGSSEISLNLRKREWNGGSSEIFRQLQGSRKVTVRYEPRSSDIK